MVRPKATVSRDDKTGEVTPRRSSARVSASKANAGETPSKTNVPENLKMESEGRGTPTRRSSRRLSGSSVTSCGSSVTEDESRPAVVGEPSPATKRGRKPKGSALPTIDESKVARGKRVLEVRDDVTLTPRRRSRRLSGAGLDDVAVVASPAKVLEDVVEISEESAAVENKVPLKKRKYERRKVEPISDLFTDVGTNETAAEPEKIDLTEESPETDQVVDLTREDLPSSGEVVDLTDKELEDADKRMENQKEINEQAQNTDEDASAIVAEKAEEMQLAPSTEKAEILQQPAKETEEEKLKQVAEPTDEIEILPQETEKPPEEDVIEQVAELTDTIEIIPQEAEMPPEEDVIEQLVAPTVTIEVLSPEAEILPEEVNEQLAAPIGEIDVVAAEIPMELDDNASSEEVPEEKIKEILPSQTQKPNKDKGNLLVKPDIIPRQKPKSGKFWKAERSQFRAIKKDRGPRLTFQQRVKRKEETEQAKELAEMLKQRKYQKKQEMKEKIEANKKRKEENEKKAEVYQVIKNPAKIKRMKKKQLRMLAKRDTLEVKSAKSAVAES